MKRSKKNELSDGAMQIQSDSRQLRLNSLFKIVGKKFMLNVKGTYHVSLLELFLHFW
jgi:hypothetical protein